MGELGRLRRYSGVRAAGKPDDFWVKNYLENGLRLPKMQKMYIKMFGSNATFFKFCLLQQTIQKVSL